MSTSVLDRINPHVAGIDCGSAEHYVAVPLIDPIMVQSFKTFTTDLLRPPDWLAACGVTSVAMEATGVSSERPRFPVRPTRACMVHLMV